MARTLFSHDVSRQSGDVAEAMRTFNAALGRPDLLPAWGPSPARARVRRAVSRLDDIVFALIDARAKEDPRADLLQTLVDAVDDESDGGKRSRREVHDELVTLFLAGHETTSNALAWTLMLLSRNPGVCARLTEQVHDVLSGRLPTLDDLDAMPLLDQVLRCGSTGPTGTRGGLMTPMFRPERFEPEAMVGLPKCAYAPFGAGPQACIGSQFSLVEARLVHTTLLSRVELRLREGHAPRYRTGVTLSPKGGLPMRVTAARSRRRAA